VTKPESRDRYGRKPKAERRPRNGKVELVRAASPPPQLRQPRQQFAAPPSPRGNTFRKRRKSPGKSDRAQPFGFTTVRANGFGSAHSFHTCPAPRLPPAPDSLRMLWSAAADDSIPEHSHLPPAPHPCPGSNSPFPHSGPHVAQETKSQKADRAQPFGLTTVRANGFGSAEGWAFRVGRNPPETDRVSTSPPAHISRGAHTALNYLRMLSSAAANDSIRKQFPISTAPVSGQYRKSSPNHHFHSPFPLRPRQHVGREEFPQKTSRPPTVWVHDREGKRFW
jgi:hypothetical protein